MTPAIGRALEIQRESDEPDVPVPPDQKDPSPVEEPPDAPAQDPSAPVREPGPIPERRLGGGRLPRQQHTLFQMPRGVSVGCGVGIVSDHHDGLSELLVQALHDLKDFGC